MAGIHQMKQVRFGDMEHFEVQPEGTDAHPDPETSCTANYDMPGDMEQDLQHVYSSYNALQEMVDIEKMVVLNPEVLMCGTNLHPETQLTFSSDGFKIEYLDSNSGQDGDLLTLFWDVSDIISIHCKWIQMVQYAWITLHVRSSAETINSGPVKVEFCLADPQWEWKQQKIWQLDSRYQEVWKNIHSDDSASQNWSTEPSLCFPKQYFHGIDDFEDVIYPKGDRDAVSISSRDVELLLPEIFVNDTIIDFYIKYLTQRIEPTERHRYHFFNSFFFRKLANLDKDQENAPKGREAFLNVRKWSRKIDIFAKEFLFIPVNFSLHWSLLVICYPGEVATFKDGDARVAGKLPCIMHMNSIKGTHSGLKDIIQSYLWEEWKERHPESASDSSDKFLNLRFISLELPRQDNLFDCGLFLLHYVERFLMDAPSVFNPMKIDVFSSFLSDDWFVPAEASLKRSLIRKLIHALVTEPSKTFPKLVPEDKNSHQESLLDILDSKQKISSHPEVEVYEHDIMVLKCSSFSDNMNNLMACQGSRNEVEYGRCEASQDIDSVTMLDASKHDTRTVQERNEGKSDNGRCDLFEDTDSFAIGGINKDVAERPFERDIVENMDGRYDLSEDTCSITIGCDINKCVAECLSERNIVKAVDPRALQDDIKAQETTATDKINDSEQYVSSESKDGNTDSILTSGTTVSSWLKEGNTNNVISCEITNGIGEAHANDKSDSVFTVVETQQESTLICSSDSEKGLPVPAHILESGGVSMVAIEDMRVCPLNNDVDVFLPSQDVKNDLFLICSVVNDEDTHGESLLDFPNKKQKISSEAEVEVHQHGIMDSKCFPFSENVDEVMACHEYKNEVDNDRSGAPQDIDSVLILDAKKNEIGLCQESTKGEAEDGRRDLSEDTYFVAISGMKADAAERSFERNIVKAMDDRCDLSEDTRSVMIDDMNSVVAECLSGTSTVEAVDPGAVEDVTQAEKTSTTAGTVNDTVQYISSESKDGNSGSIMSSVSTVSCGLQEGNVVGGTTTGTSETHADGEDACHDLEICEVAPCEDGTTCSDAEMPHVNGITTCSAKDGTHSEKATSNARTPLLGSTSEDKSTLVSADVCSLKGVQCTEDGIMKGSTREETSTISDRINDSMQYASSEYASSEWRDGNTDNAIAAESTQGSDADGHELAAFLCEGGTDAEMPPHVDGTCSAEDENNSISDSVCEVKKMQVSGGFRSTLEDDIIKGSTKQETSTVSDKINDSMQYASSELRDGNTDSAIAGESTQGTDADGHELAAFPREGGTDAEMSPHADGTCSTEDENNSISDSVCKAKKMQVSEDFQSTPEDDIVEGSTKEETNTAADKMNGSEQYASDESEDGNTYCAGSGSEQDDVPPEAKNEECRVGAKRPFPDSSICEAKEMVTLDDMFWQKYSERTEARFGRKYKRRIVYKRRKVISRAPPSSSESPDLFFWRVCLVVPRAETSYMRSYKRRPKIKHDTATTF
ncbi:unnamed protein product [Alopecurus aequalis]